MKIDIVIPWVDGADPVLLEKGRLFENKGEASGVMSGQLNGQYRYRDSGLLKYLFRSIDRFAPWVNKVFLITDNQWPDWLDYSNEKLVKVQHEDYIPEQWLPTFSSNPILLNLHRIQGLSDQFILFNDDMLINKPVKPKDFFVSEDIVKDFGIYSVIPADDPFSHLLLNNMMVINDHFSKMSLIKRAPFKVFNLKYGKNLIRSMLALPWHAIPGFFNPHTPQPYLKKTFEAVWSLEAQRLSATSSHHFRDPSDLTDWVFRYWQIQSNEFEPQSKRFVQYYEQTLHEKIRYDLERSIHSVLCINDTAASKGEEQVANSIIEALNNKFPETSQFEV